MKVSEKTFFRYKISQWVQRSEVHGHLGLSLSPVYFSVPVNVFFGYHSVFKIYGILLWHWYNLFKEI